MTQTKIRFNYQDYLLLPEEKRYEIVDGELFMVPAPLTNHQNTSLNLAYTFKSFLENRKRGVLFIAPTDVVLSLEDIVQPDILYILEERRGIITEKNIQGAPDLVVEILSPDSESKDRILKRKLYARYSVKEYWLVNPQDESIEVLVLSEAGFKSKEVYKGASTLESDLLKGLNMPLKEAFKPF